MTSPMPCPKKILLVLLLLCVHVVVAKFSCSSQPAFSCSADMVKQLSDTPAALWYTLSGSNSMSYGSTWTKLQAACCLHCIWDLGYPFANPIVIATDRTSTGKARDLDCIGFQNDFRALDTHAPQNSLSYDEVLPYLVNGINGYLQERRILNTSLAFFQADLDRDEFLSAQEWLVLRHFWAPVHLSNVGPIQRDSNGQITYIDDGPLGGLYWDPNMIEVFVNDVTNVLLAQYQYSTCCECECCSQNCSCSEPSTKLVCASWNYPPCPANTSANFTLTTTCQLPSCNNSNLSACSSASSFERKDGSTYRVLNFVDPCDPHCRWDSSFVRVFTPGEQTRVLAAWDLDGSGKISLEEHYFLHFADQDNDGALSRSEYDSSLYRAGQFDIADLNKDGVVTFLERKFLSAQSLPSFRRLQQTSVRGLTRREWMFSDLPVDFQTFDAHAVTDGDTQVVAPQGFSYYIILFQCAMQALKLYQVPLSSYPWISSCPIVMYCQNSGPWINLESNTGYLLDMWSIVSSRMMWSFKFNNSAQNGTLLPYLQPPPITGKAFGTMSMGLFAAWTEINATEYVCSRSFAPPLDGLVVLVQSNPPPLSLILAIFELIPGYGFINLVSFLIVSVFAVAHIVWLVERQGNPDQFDPKYFKGILDSSWFLFVAMSTVGYGDKVPATGPGKALSFFWLFFGVLIFSVFQGNVMSYLNLQVAAASINGPATLSGFTVGIYADSLTRKLALDTTFQFKPSYCADMGACIHQLLDVGNVSALLVPYVDVLTYMVEADFGQYPCGNPVRIVGNPIYADKLPAARLCLFGELLYAANYLLNGVQTQLDLLDAEGISAILQNNVLQQVNQDSAACILSKYDLNMIAGCIAAVAAYSIVIASCVYREKWARNKANRTYASQGGLTKTPEDLARHYGRIWKEKARQTSQARTTGQTMPTRPPPIEEDAQSFLIRMLGRVSVLNVGQSHDMRRCRHEAEILRRASKAAAWLTRVSAMVMLVLVAGLAYSISAIQFLQQPQYVSPIA